MNTLDDTLARIGSQRRTTLLAAAATLVAGTATAQTMQPPTAVSKGSQAIGPTRDEDGWFDAIPGERMRVPVTSEATGGTLTVLESIVSLGSATPLHLHGADEIFLILSGSLRLVRDGARLDLAAGSSAIVPRGVHHGFVNVTEAPVCLFAIFAPGGMDGMFLELSRTPPEGWAEVAGRFGTVIVGPPVLG